MQFTKKVKKYYEIKYFERITMRRLSGLLTVQSE